MVLDGVLHEKNNSKNIWFIKFNVLYLYHQNEIKMTTQKLQEFFEEQDFQVHLSEQDNQQCAEVEMWTDGGVDMIIWLQPFNIEQFKEYVNDFDIDEEIELHRQGNDYKNAFTIKESLNDFTKYHNHLKKIVKLLDKRISK